MGLGLGRRLRPVEGQVLHQTGFRKRLRGLQSASQDRPLPLIVIGQAHRPSEGMLHGRHARHAHGCSQVGDVRYGHRRDPRCFDLPLRQSNGPAADRSRRDQGREIDRLVSELADDLWDAILEEHIGFEQVPHE